MELSDTKNTIRISSDTHHNCSVCGDFRFEEDVSAGINHMIQQHDFTLFHVGTQTTHDNNGNIYHTTIAILGE